MFPPQEVLSEGASHSPGRVRDCWFRITAQPALFLRDNVCTRRDTLYLRRARLWEWGNDSIQGKKLLKMFLPETDMALSAMVYLRDTENVSGSQTF